MRPSEVLQTKRELIRAIVARYPMTNPRVFGSAIRGTDRDDSDLDILVDALPGASLFDIGGLCQNLSDSLGITVQVVTPAELGLRYRHKVLAEAVPL